eukprot:TRINITY_DN10045_c0_g1_i1.p1 TRINITY_DN10045_c0_g1~~TRINITY_DN10045_c0_g1_i1.p1  ORF type:complete len:504 (-),score=71.03 TRINITY_DN10045_c0_g1_i1:112-1593(-)
MADPTPLLSSAGQRSMLRVLTGPAADTAGLHLSPADDEEPKLRRAVSEAGQIAEEIDERYRQLAACHRPPSLLTTPSFLQTDSVENKLLLPMAATESAWPSEIATILVILKAFVGGTMLVLPASLLQAGLISGNLALWFVGLLELWCMLRLLRAHERYGGSFCELASMALGSGGSLAVEISILLSQLGFTAAEMIYVAKSGAFVLSRLAENFPHVRQMIGERDQASLEPMIIWFECVCCIPVSWYRELGALTIFSFVGNLCILGALLILSVFTVTGLAEHGSAGGIALSSSTQQTLMFAGFSVFAFEGITMVIPIYTAHKNKASFAGTLSWTICGIIVLFSVFSSANVLLYGTELQPVLTLNLPSASSLRDWVSCAFALGSLTLVFLMVFPTYEILETRLESSFGVQLSTCVSSGIFRSLVVVFCACIARFGGGRLDAFLSVVGALGCVPLAFIYPSAIHCALVAETKGQQLMDVFAGLVGVGIMINSIADLL